MASLQLYAPNGSVMFDSNEYSLKLLGTLTISPTSPASGNFNIPEFADGRPFFVVKAPLEFYYICSVSISGTNLNYGIVTTLSGTRVPDRPTFKILYGIA